MMDHIGEEVVRKVEEHLPDSSDPIVLVLKAHLLVEEQLVQFLEEVAPQPSHIQSAKLTFPQKVEVLQAFLPISIPVQWFQAALLLNSIRNKLAHQLSPKDLEFLERDFTKIVFAASSDIAETVEIPRSSDQETYRSALALLVIALSAARSALPSILEARKSAGSAA